MEVKKPLVWGTAVIFMVMTLAEPFTAALPLKDNFKRYERLEGEVKNIEFENRLFLDGYTTVEIADETVDIEGWHDIDVGKNHTLTLVKYQWNSVWELKGHGVYHEGGIDD